MSDDDCACGVKYATGGRAVAGVQLILGLALIITGFATIDYNCYYYINIEDSRSDYYECVNENWISWSVAIGGCVCMTAGGLLYYGIQQTRPSGLLACLAMAACSAINYFIAAVLAICYDIDAIFVVLLFAASLWFSYTVVFVAKYRRIMILQLPVTRVILATPYVSQGVYPGASAQVIINPGVQPGVYPATFNPSAPTAPPANPSYPYPGNYNPPPPYFTSPQPSV